MMLTMGITQRQTQAIVLTAAQRIAIDNTLLNRRRDLIEVLRGDKYDPKAECPRCAYRLKIAEVVRGFRRDPADITTKCPKCGERFISKMIRYHGNTIRVELQFLCPDQAMESLKGHSYLKPDKLEEHNPSAYHSALFHFGNLREAFDSVHESYGHEVKLSWRDKVRPFLGGLPDTEIARCAGVSAYKVRRYRHTLYIDAFKRSDVLEDDDY